MSSKIYIHFVYILSKYDIKINSFQTNSCLKRLCCPDNCSHTLEIKNILSALIKQQRDLVENHENEWKLLS